LPLAKDPRGVPEVEKTTCEASEIRIKLKRLSRFEENTILVNNNHSNTGSQTQKKKF
jgi:hypothetical protein